MTRLSDTQAVLLSSAAQRADGSLLPVPATLTGGSRLDKSLAGVLTRGLAEERETGTAEAVYRSDGDLRLGLYLTAAGAAAIGVEASEAPAPGTASVEKSVSGLEPTADPHPSTIPQDGKRQTKAALVLSLLRCEGGATLPELIAATGWLAHTTRAALTGLRKKGHDVRRGKRGDATCYTVAVTDAATDARETR